MAAIFFMQHGFKHLDRIVQTLGYTLLEIFCAALIVLAIAGGRTRRLCEWAPLRTVGKYSYGLYVFHYPLIPLLSWLLPSAFLTRALGGRVLAAQCLFCAVGLAVSFAAAWTSWHLVEKRLLRLKCHFEYARGNPPRNFAQMVPAT